MNPKDSPIPELVQTLTKSISGEVKTDPVSRLLYSTDASIYEFEPVGVVFPRSLDELSAAVEISGSYGVPVLARGAGSSLAGQAIGPGLILDCSRYLTRIESIEADIATSSGTAIVEPGVVLNALNRAAAGYGLQFGPDPASAERATIGGSMANNATGAHSILYGMAADHLLSADVTFADGSFSTLKEISLGEAERKAGLTTGEMRADMSAETALYRAALMVRQQLGDQIRQRWPRTWRRASGYGLNYLLPWAPSSPPMWEDTSRNWKGAGQAAAYPLVSAHAINLAPLMAGSEGTLAVFRRLQVRLVPLPRCTVLAVLSYDSIAEACDAVPYLLERHPSAIELIPRKLIHLARSVPAYAHQFSFIAGNPASLLIVEFSGDRLDVLIQRARQLGGNVQIAENAEQQRQVWAVRKVGLGILLSQPGDIRPVSFIEDLAVPVDRLGEFAREIERLLAEHETTAEMYAHASAGCLHIRPLLNLKTQDGTEKLRKIAAEAVSLTLRLGGSISGEHGDGIARSEWLEQMYGREIMAAFRSLKRAVDPKGLLNPGKILDAPPMDAHLRYGPGYRAVGWQPVMDFSSQADLAGAVEQCNGAGVCRKSEGVMCPSFQATQDEMHSTRGRANLLRAMLSGRFPSSKMAERAVYQALDLCLACKGCKAECPSAVDMAKLKYEFLQRYYSRNHRKLRDFMFGYIEWVARLGQPLAPLANWLLANPTFTWAFERVLGISSKRPFPRLARQPLRSLIGDQEPAFAGQPPVLFLADAFTELFYPETGLAAVRALNTCGLHVKILPVSGAGRTFLSKGFLQQARAQARRLLDAVDRIDPSGELAVVGVEPSEILTLRDEFRDLLPDDPHAAAIGRRAWMIDEFLVRMGIDGRPRVTPLAEQRKRHSIGSLPKVLLHGHCYQKAQPPAPDGYPTGVEATIAMLRAGGYRVEMINAGCCGMAGAFGYEVEHYDVSMKVGELALFPAVRGASEDVVIAASGVSCQSQIEDGTRRKAVHPVTLLFA